MKRKIITAISIMLLAAACLAEVSGERPVSSLAYGPPPGYRYNAAAASDGHDFLVVWVDELRNRAFNMQIYATRVSASGQVLDPLGIRIPTITQNLYQFNVVYLGNSYLVCWNEENNAAPALMGVRIRSDGVLLDSTPRVLADRGSVLTGGAASNGKRTVIVYTSLTGSLMTVVLDRDANVVDGPKPLTNPAGPSNETATVASNGRGFLVIRTHADTTYATTLDANGATVSSEMVQTFTPWGTLFDFASDGDTYVAIFGNAGQIGAQHFGPSGEMMETSAIPIQAIYPGFAFVAGSYLLMDGDPLQNTIGFRRLSHSGQPVGGYTPIASASSFSANATLASSGSNAFAGWTEWGTRHQVFNGSVIDVQSLTASTPALIANAATSQTTPAAASSGTNTAIVWNEDDGVYAGRLTFDGQLLDGQGIKVGERSLTEPRIVFDGANYIIGWTEQQASAPNTDTVKLARLAPGSGALLDPDGVTVTQNLCGSGLALAPGTNSTLVAWSDCTGVVATTVSSNLTLGVAVRVTPSQTLATGAISAAWNGSQWLLAWEDFVPFMGGGVAFDPPPYDTLIDAARLSSSLTLLDPQPIVISNMRNDSRPLVASDGDSFFVPWSHATNDSDGSGVFAQRVSSDGSLLAQVNGVRLGAGRAKSVVWDGLQYSLAFSVSHATSTLYVTHVAAHGPIEGLTPLAVVSSPSDPAADLIVTGPGRVNVTYTRIGFEAEYGDVERVFIAAPHVLRGRAVAGRSSTVLEFASRRSGRILRNSYLICSGIGARDDRPLGVHPRLNKDGHGSIVRSDRARLPPVARRRTRSEALGTVIRPQHSNPSAEHSIETG